MFQIFGCTVSTCLSDSVVHKQDEVENSISVENKLKNSVPEKSTAYVEDWDNNLKFLVKYVFSV